MTLLERGTQLAVLEDAFAETIRGRGRTIAISGEAGAGKTMLVQAFADRMAERARVLRSACEDLSIPDPLGPLHELGRHAGWTRPSRGDDRQSLLSLFSAALEVFETGSLPALLVIEDLHWADEATLDFVRFLGRRLHDRHILLLLTTRNDESEGQRRLRRALADIPVTDIVRIDVPLLTEEAVSILSEQNGKDGRAVYRATAGNAFFVMELLRAGSGHNPPPSVRDAVLARAERLSAGARKVLNTVSIFPRQVEVGLVQALCGPQSASQIVECTTAGMLDDLGNAYAFRHEIARRAIELSLPASLRRELNAGALATLRSAGDTPVARLVHHAQEAHDHHTVAELAPIAAEQASRLGAHREAMQHYRTALAQQQSYGQVERANLYERYAFECHLVGELQPAIEAESAALRLRQKQGDLPKEGDCLRWLSRLSYIAGDRRSADKYGEQAITLLEGLPPGAELAMAYSNQAQLHMLALKVEPALRNGERAIALAEAFDRPDIVCHALNNIGTAEICVDPEKGRQHLDRSLEIALQHNFPEHASRAFVNRAWMDVMLFDFRQAEPVLRSGIAYCEERDIDTWGEYLKGLLAEFYLRQGRWDQAVEVASKVVAKVNSTPLMRHPAMTTLARVRLRRGEGEIGALLEELRPYLEKGMEPQRLAPYATLKAELAWLGQGDPEEALGLLRQSETSPAPRAVFGDLVWWQRILAPDTDVGDISTMPEVYRLQLSGDWQSASAKWAEVALRLSGGWRSLVVTRRHSAERWPYLSPWARNRSRNTSATLCVGVV